MKSLFCVLLFIISEAYAALPPKAKTFPAPVPSRGILRGVGALQGGQAGSGFSVLNVRSSPIAKRSERVLFEIGDMQMQKLSGPIGYYNVEMKRDNKLIVTFTQTLNTKVEGKALERVFAKSSYVKSSQFHFDPIAQSMALELNLRKPVVIRVVSLKGGKDTGKLVLDMTEDRRR